MGNEISMVQGDLLPILSCKSTDNSGNPLSISGRSFKLNIKIGAEVLIKDYVIVDEELGLFNFVWEDGDLDKTGRFRCEVQETVSTMEDINGILTQVDKSITTDIFYLRVRKQIG